MLHDPQYKEPSRVRMKDAGRRSKRIPANVGYSRFVWRARRSSFDWPVIACRRIAVRSKKISIAISKAVPMGRTARCPCRPPSF